MTDVRTALEGTKFLTVAEIAVALRVSKMTVYRLVKNSDLESIRVGRSFRVTEESLRKYIDGRVIGGQG